MRSSAGRRARRSRHQSDYRNDTNSGLVEGLPRRGRFRRPPVVESTRIGYRLFRLLSKCSESARFRPAAANASTSIASGATIARNHVSANRPNMTFKSERRLEGRTVVLKLSGRVQAEHLEQLSRELPTEGTPAALDLTDVTLVDAAVVRFLAVSEARGVRLFGLSGFVREWIAREEKPSARSRKRKKRTK